MKIHSMVDVITNSSTEMFICDTDKSLELIKEFLEELLKVYNKMFDKYLLFDEVFEEPHFMNNEDEECLESYREYGYFKEIKYDKSKIVIEGSTDNSIPYELFGLIEKAFGAYRIHLG
jgi:hypothetical protein